VIAGHDDDFAVPLCVLNEDARPLKLTRPRALRQIAGDGDDVIIARGDDRFDRLVLLGDGGVPEVQIGAMKNARR
jgi:hypothetical protein